MAKVYVSSTRVDLESERKAVVDWIAAAGHQPVHSYRPDSETVQDSCLLDVASCDLFVLILGQRYGFIPEDRTSDKLSITHQEYRQAKASKIPCIALIRTSVPDIRLTDIENSENWMKLKGFIEEVRRELRLAEFSDGASLIQGLSTGVQSELNKKAAVSHPKPLEKTGVAFEKLRIGDIQDRVGRDDELAWLEKEIILRKTPSVALTSITGAGGMGKTFLSQVFVHQFRDRFRFVPIYLGDTSPFDAGMQLLTTLGVETSQIDNSAKLSAAMQKMFDEGGGIVVMDDVRSDDVNMLMPKRSDWRVLMTSRDKEIATKLCGQRHVRSLDVLTADEALQLYRNVLEENFYDRWEKEYLALAAHLAHRPYAVRIAAGFLREAPDQTPGRLLDKLRQGKSPAVNDTYSFTKVGALISHCLDQLETIHPLSRALMDALAVCSDEGINRSYFIEWQTLHHPEDDIDRAIRRAHACGLLLMERSRADDEKTFFDLRLHTDVQRQLQESDLSVEGLSLSEYLKSVLIDRKDGRNVDHSLQFQVWSLFQLFGDNDEFVDTLIMDWSEHLWRTGRLSWALAFEQRSELLAQVRDDEYLLHRSYGNQGLIHRAWEHLDEAMALYKKKEAICLRLRDKAGLQKCYGNQGVIQKAWGHLDEAMALYEKKEALCIELGDEAGLSKSYCNQGVIQQDRKRLDEAMALYRKQEMLCVELGLEIDLQACYGNQGNIQQAWGYNDEAMALYKKQEKLCQALGLKNSLQICYGYQADLLREMGRDDEADEYLEKQTATQAEIK